MTGQTMGHVQRRALTPIQGLAGGVAASSAAVGNRADCGKGTEPARP